MWILYIYQEKEATNNSSAPHESLFFYRRSNNVVGVSLQVTSENFFTGGLGAEPAGK